jgi:hypothetical protein
VGQLIKLQDYISRYEQNIFSYPSRFVRLKKQQWERTKENWENEGIDASNLSIPAPPEDWLMEKEKQPFLEKLKGMIRFRQEEEIKVAPAQTKKEDDEDADSMKFTPSFSVSPSSVEQLKQQFLDQLLKFQMKWASSTLSEKSFLDRSYYYEENLKFFLQRFPDTFLILYKPIFLLKKAPVEAEVIVLTPTEALCITFLEEEELSVFAGSSERFWIKRLKNTETKLLNPLISLSRTEKITRKIFQLNEIELPIKKLVICRNGYIDYPSPPADVQFIDKKDYERWFQSMRSLRSPFKHMQLKGAQSLLQYCQTTSVRRLEWGTDE